MLSLLQMSLTGAVLITVVIVIRALAINRMPKKAFLFLWAAALLRLLVPFRLVSPHQYLPGRPCPAFRQCR